MQIPFRTVIAIPIAVLTLAEPSFAVQARDNQCLLDLGDGAGVQDVTRRLTDTEKTAVKQAANAFPSARDVTGCDVSGITDFSSMFGYAGRFDQDITNWDVSSGTNFSRMFEQAQSFNQDIGNWDVGNGTNFNAMFTGASNFNQDIGNWDVSKGTNFGYMFYSTLFNQDIGNWNVSGATTFTGMFVNNSAFNQDIGSWDVSKSTNFDFMFRSATAFNQDIGSWDVANGMSFSAMFYATSAFNQDLTAWNVEHITTEPAYFAVSSALTDANKPLWGQSQDKTAPTIIINAPTGAVSDAFPVRISFSEDVSGFDVSDITIANGTASDFLAVGSKFYSLNVTPTSEGPVTIDIAAGVAADAAGNPNEAATRFSNTADFSAPNLVIIGPGTTVSDIFSVTFTFSEDVTGFEADDVTVTDGTKGSFWGQGSSYTLNVTPTDLGTPVTINVAADVSEDSAGNTNTAARQLSVATLAPDTTAPTVTLASNAVAPHSGVFPVTATFSEEVTGFELADITVGNGTASNFSGSGATYSFDITPEKDGTVSIDVAADVARDAAANGNTAATQLKMTADATPPTITISGPSENVTEAFEVTFTFSEDVTGFASEDINVTNGAKDAFTEITQGTVYTLLITPELGSSVAVSVGADAAVDAAGNGNIASEVFEVFAGSVAAEFEKYEDDIRQAIVDDAQRALNSTLASNRNMTRQARTRFIDGRQNADDPDSNIVSRNNVAFDVNGGLELSKEGFSTNGTFFEQKGNFEGTHRRLFFGDFDIQRDAENDSTIATITARVAWEYMVSGNTMFGYFAGGELASSQIAGEFDGGQERLGLTLGGYAVHQLQNDLFLDGFLTLGASRNDLEMANDALSLESDYITRTATLGAALSGAYTYAQYEFRPELAFSYGRTWIGDVGFTGRAYGLKDDSLELDAGTVSIANLMLRPELIWALDAETLEQSNSQVSFAPRLLCTRLETTRLSSDCGAGAELEIRSHTYDGLGNVAFKVVVDKVGSSTHSSFGLNLEQRF